MATRVVWDANSVIMEPRSGVTRPGYYQAVGKTFLAFDAAADEVVDLKLAWPQGMTAPYSLVFHGVMQSATSGTVGARVAVEAVTPGDAINNITTRSFDTINYATSATVPGATANSFTVTVTLTNNDGVQPGDIVYLEVGRDADGTGTTDSAANDWLVECIELRDSA